MLSFLHKGDICMEHIRKDFTDKAAFGRTLVIASVITPAYKTTACEKPL